MSDLRPRAHRRTPAIARHGRLKQSHAARVIAKFLVGTLAVVLISGVSVAAIAVWDVGSSLKPGVELVHDHTDASAPQLGPIDGAVNLLLVGSDSRQGQGNGYGDPERETGVLNDVTMLLHISADHTRATVISFPRDMFVPIPSCPDPAGGNFSGMSSQKINTTLSYGGLACSVLTVEQLTGLHIRYAALIQFNGVIEMSNAIGGVPVCVADEISDWRTNTYLKPGIHTLKGEAALQFLRTRHGVGDGSDLGRISNQQVFLSSLVRTIKSAGTLGNPTKVLGLAKAAARNMQLSTTLNSIPTMASIGMAVKGIDLNKVVFVQYPNYYGSSNGESGVLPITDAANQLMTLLKTDKPITLTGTTGVGSELDPKAGQTPAASSAPTDPADPTDPTSSTDPATILPDTVHGQTAAEQTCSKVLGD